MILTNQCNDTTKPVAIAGSPSMWIGTTEAYSNSTVPSNSLVLTYDANKEHIPTTYDVTFCVDLGYTATSDFDLCTYIENNCFDKSQYTLCMVCCYCSTYGNCRAMPEPCVAFRTGYNRDNSTVTFDYKEGGCISGCVCWKAYCTTNRTNGLDGSFTINQAIDTCMLFNGCSIDCDLKSDLSGLCVCIDTTNVTRTLSTIRHYGIMDDSEYVHDSSTGLIATITEGCIFNKYSVNEGKRTDIEDTRRYINLCMVLGGSFDWCVMKDGSVLNKGTQSVKCTCCDLCYADYRSLTDVDGYFPVSTTVSY